MIRRLAYSLARSLFTVAILLFVCAGVCLYGAIRLLKAAFAKTPPGDLNAAAFALFTDAVTLSRVLKAKVPK